MTHLLMPFQQLENQMIVDESDSGKVEINTNKVQLLNQEEKPIKTELNPVTIPKRTPRVTVVRSNHHLHGLSLIFSNLARI